MSKNDVSPGFIWLVDIFGGTWSNFREEKKVNLRLHGGEDVDEEKDRERNQK